MSKHQSLLMIVMFSLVLLSLSFTTASSLTSLPIGEVNKEYIIRQTCVDATYINISLANSQGLIFTNEEMVKNGSVWTYNITPTILGRYDVGYESDGCEKSGATSFEITSSGREVSDSKIYANIVLFIFFILLIFTFYYTTKNIDYERWHQRIINRYEYRNYMKVILSSIGYNVMKNKFIWYYLFGLPILLLVTDIAFTFGVDSMIELLKIVLAIYYWGFLLVGVAFFGFVLEWFARIVDEIKSMDFGV
jgi:hypothetical protein